MEKDDAKFCNRCGGKFEEAHLKNCVKCGKQAELNAKFCNQCGNVFALKDGQRKGFAIAGMIMPVFVFVSYITQLNVYEKMATSESYFYMASVLLVLFCAMGFVFSILGVKTCHGGIKAVAIIGLVLNCLITIMVLVMIFTTGACVSCISSQSSSSYDYYSYYDY